MPAKPRKLFRDNHRPNDYYYDYDKLMNEQDKKMLEIMNSNLDILLIFAALFSGVNGAFIATTLTLLIPDPTDTINALLYFLIRRLDNTTDIPSDIYPSPPSPGSTRVNVYFCVSLACSLIVALGAIIGKQWLIYYDRTGDVDPVQSKKSWRPLGIEHQGRERLRKLRGMQRWQLRVILEAGLPTLLQIAVLIFFLGLIDFMHSVKSTVGWVALGIATIGFVFYMITVAAAMWDPDCPFQTPVTKTVLPYVYHSLVGTRRSIIQRTKTLQLQTSSNVCLAIQRLCRSRLLSFAQRIINKAKTNLELIPPVSPTSGCPDSVDAFNGDGASASRNRRVWRFVVHTWSRTLQGLRHVHHLTKPITLRLVKCAPYNYLQRMLAKLRGPSNDGSTTDSPTPINPYTVADSDLEEINAPSTGDIQVVSWILSTSMDPKALRTAAASLPYIYVPSILTTDYLDISAISRLDFLFRNGVHQCKDPKSRSPEAISDLLVYAEALYHAFLASFIGSRLGSASGHPRVLPWWESYHTSLVAGVSGLSRADLYAYRWLVGHAASDTTEIPLCIAGCLIGNPSLEQLPLCVAGMLCYAVTTCYQWDGILEALLRDLKYLPPRGVSMAERSVTNTRGGLMMVDSQEVPRRMKAIWDAYTDERNLFPNFLSACAVYVETSQSGVVDPNWEKLFKDVVHSLLSIGRDLDLPHPRMPDEVLSAIVQVVSVAARGWSADGGSTKTMVEDCMTTICDDRYYPIPITLLDPLCPLILLEDASIDLLELIVRAIAKMKIYDDDVKDLFSLRPDVLKRLLTLLNHPGEGIRLESLRLIGYALRDSDLPECLNRLSDSDEFAHLLITQLKNSPTRPVDMFCAVRLCSTRLCRKRSRLASVFYDEAVSQPVNPSIVLLVLELYEDSRHPNSTGCQNHPNWFSDKMITAVTAYLVTMSDSPDPWQDGVPVIENTVEIYYKSVIESSVNAETPLILRFDEAFRRWRTSHQDRMRTRTTRTTRRLAENPESHNVGGNNHARRDGVDLQIRGPDY
ncbi:hypothetical protein FRB99_000924 [Tulasnella sp. 403]|nr:hypothetical protein FRB99_000924 [Tulasnella sp. 403]